jgi:amino acid permease
LVDYIHSSPQVTTIPAFVNNVHPSTNIRRVIWLSLVISCSIYLVIGLTGASAFHTPENSTILAVISDRRPSVIAIISVYAFPVGEHPVLEWLI